MKNSYINQSDLNSIPKTPTRGLNTTVKNSFISINNNKQASPHKSSIHNNQKLLLKDYVTQSQNFIQNPTTDDNSLAKTNKLNKSMIKINFQNNMSDKKHNHSHSQSKRKKFISITQRDHKPSAYNSQKKHFNFITQRQNNKQTHPTNYINPFSTFRQMLPPANTLRQYWSTMIDSISNRGSKIGQNEELYQQIILNQDIVSNQKQFSIAQKARLQRKTMMNSLIFTQKKDNHKQFRAHTQMREKSLTKDNYILITQPEYPIDSRNFMVFQEKVGENTLTRKDSLILALIEHLGENQSINNNNQNHIQNGNLQKDIIPLTFQDFGTIQTKKFQSLVSQQHQQLPFSSQKLKDKTLSTNQQNKKLNGKLKQNKIKCISLIQKQQQFRYKNCQKQSELKEKFINLKKKTQQYKS